MYAIIAYVIWLVGQAVKTPASHAGNEGSIPSRVTISICFYRVSVFGNSVFFYSELYHPLLYTKKNEKAVILA